MINLNVCGVYDVPQFARANLTDIISIGDPDGHPDLCQPQPPPDFSIFPTTRIHRFEFQDVAHVCETGPNAVHVQRLLDVCDELIRAKEDVRVLVHCQAGISRSTASAFILCVRAGLTYQQAHDYVLSVRGILMPNLLMIKYADVLMGQGGKMLDFIVSARPGEPFVSDAAAWVKANGHTFQST